MIRLLVIDCSFCNFYKHDGTQKHIIYTSNLGGINVLISCTLTVCTGKESQECGVVLTMKQVINRFFQMQVRLGLGLVLEVSVSCD